jgi:1-deoxyxylulose-5-phosphate synthase
MAEPRTAAVARVAGTAMKYGLLGRTGVRVSTIALGTATFGVAPDSTTADRVVHRALDLGINLFDCANSYGNQARFDRPGVPPAAERESAEEILGRALKHRRADVVVCSKVMEPVGDGANERGLSRLHIFDQIERSLRRLATDTIDVYYAHHPDPATPIEQTLRAFEDLIRQGKIRYYALSTFPASQMVEALWVGDRLGLSPPACNQIPYNLAMRGAARDLLPACLRYGLSATVFSPLAGGLFAGESVHERTFAGSKRWGGPGFSDHQLSLSRQLSEPRVARFPASRALGDHRPGVGGRTRNERRGRRPRRAG